MTEQHEEDIQVATLKRSFCGDQQEQEEQDEEVEEVEKAQADQEEAFEHCEETRTVFRNARKQLKIAASVLAVYKEEEDAIMRGFTAMQNVLRAGDPMDPSIQTIQDMKDVLYLEMVNLPQLVSLAQEYLNMASQKLESAHGDYKRKSQRFNLAIERLKKSRRRKKH